MTCTIEGNNSGVTLEATVEEGNPHSVLKNVMNAPRKSGECGIKSSCKGTKLISDHTIVPHPKTRLSMVTNSDELK
jgi:hypothetical protein